jgi:hypothetical protein
MMMRADIMDPFTPTMNEAYLRYAGLLVRNHSLLAEGNRETKETKALEEEMTKAWEPLDSDQRKSLSGLGSDLGWVRRKGAPAPHGPRTEDVAAGSFQALLKAKDDKDWHLMLHQLRLCSPQTSSFKTAWDRGRAWAKLKQPRIAWLFYNFAAQLQPSNGHAAIVALHTLSLADPDAAISRAREIVADQIRNPVVVVVFSAAMLLQNAEKERRPIDRPQYASLLRQSLDRVRFQSDSDSNRRVIYQFATFCFWALEEWDAALQCCEEGLKRDPDHKWLLRCKKRFLHERKTEDFTEALVGAVRVPASAVWPH